MKFQFSKQIFEKVSNIKFNQNPSSGSRVVTCWQTEDKTDVTNLTAAFRSFAKSA